MAAGLDVAFEVALLLLEVLRLQEQSLGPDHSAIHRHVRQTAAPPLAIRPRPPRAPNGRRPAFESSSLARTDRVCRPIYNDSGDSSTFRSGLVRSSLPRVEGRSKDQ